MACGPFTLVYFSAITFARSQGSCRRKCKSYTHVIFLPRTWFHCESLSYHYLVEPFSCKDLKKDKRLWNCCTDLLLLRILFQMVSLQVVKRYEELCMWAMPSLIRLLHVMRNVQIVLVGCLQEWPGKRWTESNVTKPQRPLTANGQLRDPKVLFAISPANVAKTGFLHIYIYIFNYMYI